jgi:ATP-binding cassette subfamily F protein uup
MNLLSISEASKEIGDKLLYKDISFGIDENEKIAIIGVNGCGKSTLLRIIAGLDHFDKGKYATNNNLVCGYLEQTVAFEPGQTIQDFIFASSNQRVKVLRDYLALQLKIEHGDFDGAPESENRHIHSELEKLEEKMSALDAWKLESLISKMREILSHLNIHDIETPMRDLSGGMLRKVALARLLIEDHNLLLLDEPTNHLDIDSIAWLEAWLMKVKKAMIIITHDRYFLDNITDNILEIDQQQRQIKKFKGNYSTFLEKKAEIDEIEQRTIAKNNNILTRELKWLSRMPKARGTKQKARIQSIEIRQDFVAGKKPQEGMGNFYSAEGRLGKRILEAVNISKSFQKEVAKNVYNDLIFPSFTYEFRKKERIAVIGDNGAGKTTFLKILMKSLEPDTGSVIHGVNTKIGYLSQMSEPIDENLSVIGAVREIANYIEYEDGKKISATQILDRFLFLGSKHNQKVTRLSGGERRRLDIIRILMTNPNFLILDEPTNDLDLQTLSIFEDYLLDFSGCLIVVSHDRYFLDKLADMLFIFEKGKPIRQINGICSDYLFQKSLDEKHMAKDSAKNTPGSAKIDTTTEKTSEKLPGKTNKSGKLSYKHEIRKNEILKELPTVEAEVKSLEEKLSSGETDNKKLEEWYVRQTQKEQHLLSLMAELEAIDATM